MLQRVRLGISGLQLAVAITALCAAPWVHAESTTTDTGTSSGKLDYDTICGTVLDKECKPVASASGTPSSTDTSVTTGECGQSCYCEAACSSKKAAGAARLLGITWAAVGAVCLGACATSLGGMEPNQWVCIGTQLAGAGVEVASVIALKKEFSEALGGIMAGVGGAAGSLMANQTIGKSALFNKKDAASTDGNALNTEGADSKKKDYKDVGACAAAASAGIQSYTRFKTMSEAEKAEQDNLALAQSYTSSDGTAVSSWGTTPTTDGSGSGNETTSGSDSTTSDGSTSTSADSGDCTSGTSTTVACAAALDSALPGWVDTPAFNRDFEQKTGAKLEDFMNGATPANALPAAMGAGLPASASGQLTAAVEAMQKKFDSEVPGTLYSGGGKGGAASGGGDSTAALGGLFQQFLPKAGKSSGPLGGALVFGSSRGRKPAGNPDDPNWGIFDRVTFRYGVVIGRLGLEPKAGGGK